MSKADLATKRLKGALGEIAEVRGPGEADEPILHPAARSAVFEWLAELRAAADLREVGIAPRSTCLLHGPPGCGKTTLAHHLAARQGVPLVLIGAENLVDKYLGESEKRVARLFEAIAAANVPAVIFIDEIDSIGGKRSSSSEGASRAMNAMMTVLLRKIEEFEGLLIAATNLPDHLDPALWRRFHLQLKVDLPTDDERYAIMARYLAPYVLQDDALEALTEATDGASPALLRSLMEGIKRALVLAPRLGREAGSARDVIGRIVASVAPPPHMPAPPLWSPGGVDLVEDLMWPPVRG